MSFVFFGLLLLLDLLAMVFAPNCQPIAAFMGARVLVYPVILVYAAMALPFSGALVLAFITGLFWDLLTLNIVNRDPLTQAQPIVEIPLGWSIIVCCTLAVLAHGLRPLFMRGRWDIYCLVSGACTVVILLAEYLMIVFRLHGLIFPKELWARILLPGFFAMLMAVPAYFLFNAVAYLIGYEVRVYEDQTSRRRAARPSADFSPHGSV